MARKIAVYDTQTRMIAPNAEGKMGLTHFMSFERMMRGLLASGELRLDGAEVVEIQIGFRGLEFILERKS